MRLEPMIERRSRLSNVDLVSRSNSDHFSVGRVIWHDSCPTYEGRVVTWCQPLAKLVVDAVEKTLRGKHGNSEIA
jgi:hypothetical protein